MRVPGAIETVSSDPGETARIVLRVGIAGLLLDPGVSRFLTYEQSVQFFQALGIPSSEIVVPVVGGIEIAVASALLLDRIPRISTLLAMPVMLVAAATVGPTWRSLGILLATGVLIGLETTAYDEPSATSTG
jgi:uncharacterized membrane protein YphA (DoxX/SURF4 family)